MRLTAFDEYGTLLSTFLPRLRALAGPDEDLILLGQIGASSKSLAEMLAEGAGYSHLYNVTEGIEVWIAKGYPVSR